MTEFMEDVIDQLNLIFKKYMTVIAKAQGEELTKVRAIMDDTLDIVLAETDPITIARKMNLAELELKK